MLLWILLFSVFLESVDSFNRYNPFHPCRGDWVTSTQKDQYGSDELFCYLNFGNLNDNDKQVVWMEVEWMCQDLHDDAHNVWILTAEEDQWIWDNVKTVGRHLWIGLAKRTWGSGSCTNSNWYWVPQDDSLPVDYAEDTKAPTDHFICGECHRSGTSNDAGDCCYFLNWCPSLCCGAFPLGSNGNDEGCAVMYDYNGADSPYNSYWKGLNSTAPTWGDYFCNVDLEFDQYNIPVDGSCKMKVPICNSKYSTEMDVCSGHGYCLHDDDCFCYPDYFGDNCEFIHNCSDVRADDDSVCSGKGNCTKSDHCVCLESYYGTNCENQLVGTCLELDEMKHTSRDKCYKNYGTGYTYDETSALCKTWIEPPETTKSEQWSQMIEIHSSLDEDFILQNKEDGHKIQLGLKKHPANYLLYPCPPEEGYVWDDLYSETQYPVAKGQSVLCFPPDTDDDPPSWCIGMGEGYFWEDHDCEDTSYDAMCQYTIPRCQGFTNDDIYDVCSSRGTCTYEDTCVCISPYYGLFCDFWKCYDIQMDEDDVCSGHGSCLGPDWCDCDDGYVGLSCNETLCHYVPSTSEDTCSGHGECVATDTCYCEAGWFLDDCSATYPCQVEDAPGGELAIYDKDSVISGAGLQGTEHMAIFQNTQGPDSCMFYPEPTHKEGFYEGVGYCQDFHPLFTMYNVMDPDEWEFQFFMKDYIFPSQNCYYVGMFKRFPYTTLSCPEEGFDFFDGSNSTWLNLNHLDFHGCEDLGLICLVFWANSQYDDVICMQLQSWVCQIRMYTCDTYVANEPESCNGYGLCLEEEKCTCFREKGFFGDYCETRECFGIISFEDEVCNAHGDCVDDNVCACTEGWFGENCTITWCDGVFTNETDDEGGLGTLTCHGHGQCYQPDTCKCDYKYFGDDCEHAYCNWIRGDRDEVCSGHGSCWPADTCSCNTTENDYWGQYCQYWTCFGVGSDDYSVCSSGGECVGIDECKCLHGYYFEEKCNVTICSGIFSNDSNVCSKRGECWPYGTCTCDVGYYGDCDKPICFDYPAEHEDVCSGNGICEEPDVCNCTDPWLGDKCDVVECFGYFSYQTELVCSGFGSCVGKDNCSCIDDAEGVNCNITFCNGTRSTDDSVCSGRGNCTAPNTCACIEGYSYHSFCRDFMCFGLDENDEKVCNSEGDCIGGNLCNCSKSEEHVGIRCLEWFPFSKNDIELYYDFFGDRRIMNIPYETPEELIREEVNTKIPINDIFHSITAETEDRREIINDPFGTSDEVTAMFVVEDGMSQCIQIILDPEADLIEASSTYRFTFFVQDSLEEEQELFSFEFSPTEDEEEFGGDDDLPFEDNNDTPDENIDEEDEEGEVEDDDDEDVDSSSSEDGGGSNVGAVLGGVFGSIIVIIILAILCVYCCCTIICCCVCVCCSLVVRVSRKKLVEYIDNRGFDKDHLSYADVQLTSRLPKWKDKKPKIDFDTYNMKEQLRE